MEQQYSPAERPNPNPEQTGASFEAPDLGGSSLEGSLARKAEKLAQPEAQEANKQISSAMPQTTSLPTPVPVADDESANAQNDDNPLIAADEDLIEKEWVDKVKNIISSTKNDPYKREQGIKAIQMDYIYKRYGKKIGAVQD